MKKWLFPSILVLAVLAIVVWRTSSHDGSPSAGTKPLKTVRMGLTAYPDTSMFLYGMKKGYFAEEGMQLDLKDTTWNEQIEFVAGGGTDLAMAGLDEVAAKVRSLDAIGKPIVYFMPGWSFEGTIYVSRPEIKPLSEFKKTMTEKDAKNAFLKQLVGRIMSLPEGGMYDHAIREFIKGTDFKAEDFRFVNSQLEVGINALTDKEVGLAAAGGLQRPEAIRRGYSIALAPADVGAIALSGFICSKDYYEKNKAIVEGFARGWYKTTAAGLANQPDCYSVVMPELSKRGAKTLSLDDYKATLTVSRFPDGPEDAKKMFLDSASPRYWMIPWNNAVDVLKESGKGDQVPQSTQAFVFGDLIEALTKPK